MVQLTSGICSRLSEATPAEIDEIGGGYTVQLVSIKKVAATSAAAPAIDRYRIIMSDGVHFIQAMLATQLNELVANEEIVKNTVVIIDRLTCNVLGDKRLIIVLDLHVVSRDEEKIGNPTAAPSLAQPQAASEAGTAVSAPAHQASHSAVNEPRPVQPGPATSNRPGRSIFPIEGLSPYQNNWTIKARVTQKTEIRTWVNQRGEGKLFGVTLMDESGEIRATAFNAVVDMLYNKLEEGKVYYISKARVNLAKKKFSNVQNEYELNLERNTEVEECLEPSSVPTVKYNFIPLAQLEQLPTDSICDVICVVKEVGKLEELTSKTNRTFIKRDLIVVDKSQYAVKLTLWGKQAETFAADDLPVIAFKGVKVGDFGGKSLSMLSSSVMTISPDIEEAHLLRGWYDGIGAEKTFQSYSNMSSGGGSSMGFNRKEIRSLVDIKKSQIADKAEFFSTRATVMHVKSENIAYPACPSCGKKVTEVNERWSCEKCDKTHERPEYRYILSMAVSDWSGQAWLQGFNDAGLAVLEKTADEIMEMKERDESEYNAYIAQVTGKTYNFSCRAKLDTYNDQTRVRYGIAKVSPLDHYEEAKYLRDLLLTSPWGQGA
ncbi:hypothetical protein F5J12DRAFT_806286 [Pisolithus orientalis]|uniref:uncharacterized protein n=1 Tax=Pisolithus orientalis TaxID=936130 RepID=UPI002224A1F9|nr:uncharacterized protein F5J12DRAFT_806286 [Pisolithus orientalis]KAI6028571.1 hypothetical protein F5J12DRAFT_806286 [Pisolithus orientalis]